MAAQAVHDPGKIVADLAVALDRGGDCLADIAALRAELALFGPAASDPVVSRPIARLAADASCPITAGLARRNSPRSALSRMPTPGSRLTSSRS